MSQNEKQRLMRRNGWKKMNRKLLEPSDYPALKPFFEKQPYNLSIYSLLSLIVWNTGAIRSSYLFDRDRLLIASESPVDPEKRYLILPISDRGLLTPEELHDLAIDHGHRHYRFVPGNYLDMMELRKVENWFKVSEQPEFEDYVYRTEDLISLRGNRYAGKRNLISQFMQTFGRDDRVTVTDMTQADTDVCLAFLEEWCKQRECHDNESLACEQQAVIHALTHLKVLEVAGIVVRIDGDVNAFAIMSRLNETTGVLHFEKAFSQVRGLYQFLDRECARRLFSQYAFLNKESDLNIEALAQSKRSYHPVLRIKSYRLTVR
jgi:hypothetical protein